MNEKRTKVQKFILSKITKLDPSGKNTARLKIFFEEMTDKEFDNYMRSLRDGEDVLTFYSANIVDKVDIPTLIDSAKELDVDLFERIRMWDEPTKTFYLTPHKYCVLQLPVRKMSQFNDHKLAVAEGDSHIDLLTGQVIKPDRAGSLSQVETQALFAHGLEQTIVEMLKYRGGDVVGGADYKRELEEMGKTSLEKHSNTKARSAVILDVLFSGMHIESNASGV